MKGRRNGANPKNRPTVKVKPRSYQPKKSELEERVYLPTSPERAARAISSLVNVQETDDPK